MKNMKKRKWYSVSKTFAIVLIAIVISYALIPGYIWLKWHSGEIMAFLSGEPLTSSPTTPYYNADFGVILHSKKWPHFSKAFFYTVDKDGKTKRVYAISRMKPSAGRPTFIKRTERFYFPHFRISEYDRKEYGYVTILSGYSAHTEKIPAYSSEFVTGSKGRIIIDVGGKIFVFDTHMHLLQKISDENGRSIFHIYKYENKIYGMEISKDDTYLIRLDSKERKIAETIHYDFPVVPDGNHCAIVRFNGEIYALGYDAPLIPGTYVHKVIYRLTDKITPAYIFPRKIKICSSIKNCDSKLIYSDNPRVEFGFESFIPINPAEGEFVLLGRTSLLNKHTHSYLYFTKENKFVKFPDEFVEGEDFAYDTGIYTKERIFIATDRYLIEFDGKKFKIADTFSERDIYESAIFAKTW